MIRKEIAQNLQDSLPERPVGINNDLTDTREEKAQEAAEKIIQRNTAKELARMKYREQCRLAAEQKRAEEAQRREELGIPDGRTEFQHKMLHEQEERVKAVNALEKELRTGSEALMPDLISRTQESQPAAVSSLTPERAAALTSTTRPDVARLLTSLNINLNLQLSKDDTANLLACLLTCNEAQLLALSRNPKVPVVIKTVIKRLQQDMEHGQMHTIESLWDRLFGKAGMSLNLPQAQAEATGIIPGKPISREAYIILRDTLIK